MPLSFTEKRTLQKQISTNLAALAAGNVSFTDKRRLQKEITDAMAKLGADKAPQPEKILLTDAQASVAETEEWNNADIWDEGEEYYREAWRRFADRYDTGNKTLTITSQDDADLISRFLTDRVNAMDDDPAGGWGNAIKAVNNLISKIGAARGRLPKGPQKAPAPTYADWERAVTDAIIAKLSIPNGDAQGMVEAQAFLMQQAWGQGLDAQATSDKIIAAGTPKYYHLQTRNWNQSAEAKALLDDTLQYGVIRYQNAAGDNDDKYVLDTTDKALADKVDGLFRAAQGLSGGDATYDVLDKPYTELADGLKDTYLPDGWAEAEPGGLATSKDPETGGIVDSEILSGEWFVIPENPSLQKMTGFKTRKDAFEALAAALATLAAPKPQSQNLLDLQSGKFDSLDPLAFLGKLKEIADEINDIEPLKGPAIAYIEKNSERVSAVMESALQETFGKLWGKGAAA